MKVVVQIPCFNESATLAETVRAIPRSIPGVSKVEILVIDDGSTDGTAMLARDLGVDAVVRHTRNRGLAQAFRTGIEASLARGADIIVNTDGDNQYDGADIPRLLEPILAGRADIVVGDRQTRNIAHFSPQKKVLQALGSFVVRCMSGTRVADAVSGFRAISRAAALQLNIVSSFSYTTEMLIQAGNKRLAVESVPIRTNPSRRKSRLAASLVQFIRRTSATMLRSYAMYRPLSIFATLGLALAAVGSAAFLRFLHFFLTEGGRGHVQSLVIGGALLVLGFMVLLIGVVADLTSQNRELLEQSLEKLRLIELRLGTGDAREAERGATGRALSAAGHASGALPAPCAGEGPVEEQSRNGVETSRSAGRP